MNTFNKIFSLMGTAVFLFYGSAWLCVNEEYFMPMIIGLLIAGHHYMHYKHIKQIQQERALNYMVMDAVQTAWGVEGVKRLATVAGQRFIDNAPDDIKRDCAETVKESLEQLNDFVKDLPEKDSHRKR
jgi:hypothetical protein